MITVTCNSVTVREMAGKKEGRGGKRGKTKGDKTTERQTGRDTQS